MRIANAMAVITTATSHSKPIGRHGYAEPLDRFRLRWRRHLATVGRRRRFEHPGHAHIVGGEGDPAAFARLGPGGMCLRPPADQDGRLGL